MSDPYLLPEIFDYIVDILHDKPDTLRQCCLVSKSWVPRTRKHLFAAVAFLTEKHLGSWKEVFPDLSTSPAHYTKILFVACPQVITAADADAGGWIRGFSRVVYLVVRTLPTDSPPSLVPLHGLSPVMKSLRMSVPTHSSSRIINLVLSFPLLEDLRLTATTPPGISADDDDGSGRLSTATQPSSPPMLTGSLELSMEGGMGPFIHQLLALPGGIHFRKFAFKWFHEEDPLMATALVEGCSHALESLDITEFCTRPRSALIDLSEATKLKDVVFRPTSQSVKWITMALKTAPKLRDLREISIHMPHYMTTVCAGAEVTGVIGEASYGEWLDLDCLLVQFWETRSIRPKFVCPPQIGMEWDMSYCVGYWCLLPETTKKGIIDLVESSAYR